MSVWDQIADMLDAVDGAVAGDTIWIPHLHSEMPVARSDIPLTYSIPKFICWLHEIAPRGHRACADVAIEFGKQHGVDLFALCQLKCDFNRTRPHRHGGKVA